RARAASVAAAADRAAATATASAAAAQVAATFPPYPGTRRRSFHRRAGPGVAPYLSDHPPRSTAWAKAVVDVILMWKRARTDLEADRALKWYIVLHLLFFRATRGGEGNRRCARTV
ncbi:MAG: hypothetical protein AAGA68_27470, partial [Pseudomonadota bacterium]